MSTSGKIQILLDLMRAEILTSAEAYNLVIAGDVDWENLYTLTRSDDDWWEDCVAPSNDTARVAEQRDV